MKHNLDTYDIIGGIISVTGLILLLILSFA